MNNSQDNLFAQDWNRRRYASVEAQLAMDNYMRRQKQRDVAAGKQAAKTRRLNLKTKSGKPQGNGFRI